MNQTKQVPAIMKIFAIISVALAGLALFLDFLRPLVYHYSLSISYIFESTFNTVLFVGPIALMFLYVLNLGSKDNPFILLVIALGVASFGLLIDLIDAPNAMNVLFCLPLIALCALTIVFGFVKGDSKLFGIITAGVGMFRLFINLIEVLDNGYFGGFYIFTYFIEMSATTLTFVVLLLAALNGFLTLEKKPAPAQNQYQPQYQPQAEPIEPQLTVEQSLALLKERFENGMISEAEYQEKRAEIISKL